MPVRSVVNQFLGVNAHLHSFWQGMGKWNRFHNYYVAQLMGALKAKLLPMGYTAELEESLQIRRLGDDRPRRPKADVIVRDLEPGRVSQSSPSPGNGAQMLTVEELLEEVDTEHPYSAVVIYERLPDFRTGDAVAWIELLSPSNKGESSDANAYLGKRWILLEQGLIFVEVDYLHETPPTFHKLTDYTQNEPGSHSYRIVVLDPRPNFRTGPTSINEFDVDNAIPNVTIPLNAGDSLRFDFGEVYQKTFIDGLYGYDMDYAELPLNFDRYSKDDQTRIAARMLAVLEAACNDVDLETGLFPVKVVELEMALSQIEALKKQLGEQT